MRRLFLGLWQRLRGTPGSPTRAALGVAVGLFIGCQPLYGLHLVLVLAVCLPLRLDAVSSYLAANISNPLFAPFLILAEVEVGALLTGRAVGFDLARARASGAAGFAEQLLIGSLALGAVLSLLGFAVSFFIARQLGAARRGAAPDPFEAACERVRARYARAPAADRYYVAAKLATDPVFPLIAALPGHFGRVWDVGCGRGQLGLLLLELGRAAQVQGCDTDARKIEVATLAGPEARFGVADAVSVDLGGADTILLIDVLHYLPPAEQDSLLQAAAAAVARGGRLLIRELDASPSARGKVTRFFEWCARRTGFNRGRATHYRPAQVLTQLLEQQGLTTSVQGASARTPFANVLIVAAGSPSA